MSKQIPPFGVRMPEELHQRIKADAERNNRSMNAEIVARLEGQGMTLRDYFAGVALMGLVSAVPEWNATGLAKRAYRYADAMLEVSEASK